MWPVDEQWNNEILAVHIDDEAVISLPENRSTGFRWMLEDDPEPVRRPTAQPHPFAPPLPGDLGESSEAFLDTLGSRPEATGAPTSVLRRLRARAKSTETPDASVPPEPGTDLVADQYLTPRASAPRASDARAIRLAVASGDDQESSTKPVIVGATGRRLLGVRFGAPGAHTVRLVYRSPYARIPDEGAYALHAVVENRRTGFSVNQLASEDVDDEWIDGVRTRQAAAAPC